MFAQQDAQMCIRRDTQNERNIVKREIKKKRELSTYRRQFMRYARQRGLQKLIIDRVVIYIYIFHIYFLHDAHLTS